MYTVRDDAARDLAGTLAQVAQIGYAGVELAGYAGHTASDVRKMLDTNGLFAVGGHTAFDLLSKNLEQVIADTKTLGASYVIVPYIGQEWRNGLDDYKRLGATLAEFGHKLHDEGLTLCYHNHDFEFNKFGGDTHGYDVLFDAATLDTLQVEMDTFWVKKAGEDPAAYLAKYAGRVPLVHLKDMTPEGDFAPVGEGTIDYPSLFDAAEGAGAKFYVVEQDKCTTATPLESIAISFKNLQQMGKA
jgi:sugar phosphate isomerase/epimerase